MNVLRELLMTTICLFVPLLTAIVSAEDAA